MLKTTPGVDLVLGGLPARVDSVTEPTPSKDALRRPALLACVLGVSPEKKEEEKKRSVQKTGGPFFVPACFRVTQTTSGSLTAHFGGHPLSIKPWRPAFQHLRAKKNTPNSQVRAMAVCNVHFFCVVVVLAIRLGSARRGNTCDSWRRPCDLTTCCLVMNQEVAQHGFLNTEFESQVRVRVSAAGACSTVRCWLFIFGRQCNIGKHLHPFLRPAQIQ